VRFFAVAAEHGERIFRAQAYVEGRMSPAEREAAELLLEIDGDFRLAVLDAAERLGLLPRTDRVQAGDWQDIHQKLSALPHMQGVLAGPAAAPPPLPVPAARGKPTRAWLSRLARLLGRLSPRRG
jgi:hypothetical protein